MSKDWRYLFLKEDGVISCRKYKYPLPEGTIRAIYTPQFIWDRPDEKRRAYFKRVEGVKKCLQRMVEKGGEGNAKVSKLQ